MYCSFRCIAGRYLQRTSFNDFNMWLETGILFDGENKIGPKVLRWLYRRQNSTLNALTMGFHPRLGAKKYVSDDVLSLIVKALHRSWRADLSLHLAAADGMLPSAPAKTAPKQLQNISNTF